MNEPVLLNGASPGREGQCAARAIAQWNLAALGAGFAWFAYIDAPITDGAMWLFAAAVAAALVSLIAALVSAEARLPPFAARMRRAALLLFAVAMALLLTAATVTLNLKGSGTDDSDTQTDLLIPA